MYVNEDMKFAVLPTVIEVMVETPEGTQLTLKVCQKKHDDHIGALFIWRCFLADLIWLFW